MYVQSCVELCGMNLWGDEVLSELAFHRRVTFVCCEERKENDGNMTDWQRLSCVDIGAREKQWSEITTKDEHL
jgi:hypothetical protein